MGMFDFMLGGGGEDLQQVDPAAKEAVSSATALADKNAGYADDIIARKRTLYNPIEEKYLRDALTIDSQANQDLAAADAGQQVGSSFDNALASEGRRMASYGISPNSGRFAGLTRRATLGKAAATANAMNQARLAVRDRGITLRGQVAGQGRADEFGALNINNAAANTQIGASHAITGITRTNNDAIAANNERDSNNFMDLVSIGAGLYGFGMPSKPSARG